MRLSSLLNTEFPEVQGNVIVGEDQIRMNRIIQACGNVVLLVTSVMVGTVLGELGCRLAGYTTSLKAFPITLYPQFYHKADPVNGYDINEEFVGGPFEFAEYIHNYGAPFPVTSNNVGCRDRTFERDDGYVLLIGDSHTWGYVPLEQTWGMIVEDVLGTRVLKCGVAGYGSRQERNKLETVVAKAGRPRLVIVGYCVGNDLLDDYLYPSRAVIDGHLVTKVKLEDAKLGIRKVYSDDELGVRLASLREEQTKKIVRERMPNGFMARTKDFLSEHSVLYDLLRRSEHMRPLAVRIGLADPPSPISGLEVYRSTTELPWLGQAWVEHLANLQGLKRAAASVGANLFVVLIPNSYQVYEFLRPQNVRLDWEYPTKKLGQFFQHEGIAYLDLAPQLKQYARRDGRPLLDAQQDLYWQYDGHMNVKGNLLTGLLIAQQVLQLPFLELQDKGRRVLDVEQRLSTLRVVAQ